MNKFISSLLFIFAAIMVFPFSSRAEEGEIVFTYDYEGATLDYFGVQRKVGLDAAMLLKDPSFVGMQIIGISVDIPTKEGCSCDPNASAWLTKSLQVKEDYNLPDLQQKNGVITNYGTDSEPQLRLDITFDQPYTMTEDGVYVGYSVLVTNCNVPGSGWTSKYPLVTVTNIDKPNAFMVHTYPGESTLPAKYPEWTNIGEDLHQALAMRVIMRGQKLENAAALEPLQTLYVAPGQSGYVYTNLNNYGTTPISSVEYSYTIGNDADAVNSGTKTLTLNPPVLGQIGAYTMLDLSFNAPDAVGTYPVSIRVEKVNGVANSYTGTSTLDMEVVPFVPDHKPVIEDYTGLWCSNCPAVYVGLKQMGDKYGEDLLSLAYHYQDQLQTVAIADMPGDTYGIPKVYIENRSEPIDYGNMDFLWQRVRRTLAPADVEVKLYWDDATHKSLRAVSKVRFIYDDPDANYKLAYALVEDGMRSPSLQQRNEYTNQDIEGPYWDLFCGKPFNVSGLTFDDVIVNFPAPYGINGSLPSKIEAGRQYQHSSVLNLSDAVCVYASSPESGKNVILNNDKLRVVALLIDGKTGNVRNAATTGYSADAKVYDILTGIDSLENDAEFAEIESVDYYTLDGVRLISAPENGFYIEVTRMGDGSVRAEKKLK